MTRLQKLIAVASILPALALVTISVNVYRVLTYKLPLDLVNNYNIPYCSSEQISNIVTAIKLDIPKDPIVDESLPKSLRRLWNLKADKKDLATLGKGPPDPPLENFGTKHDTEADLDLDYLLDKEGDAVLVKIALKKRKFASEGDAITVSSPHDARMFCRIADFDTTEASKEARFYVVYAEYDGKNQIGSYWLNLAPNLRFFGLYITPAAPQAVDPNVRNDG